ncbi:MAG: hypothetical protein ACR2OC_12135 [Solirubrobacterales bacterium]
MASRTRNLLEPGREAEWKRINRDEAEDHRRASAAMSPRRPKLAPANRR